MSNTGEPGGNGLQEEGIGSAGREGETSDKTQISEITDKSAETPQLDPSKVEYVGDKCYYTDPNTGTKLLWDETKKEWGPSEDLSRNYKMKNGSYHYTDQNSGVEYKWNVEGNEWQVTSPKKTNDDDDDSEEFDDEDEGSLRSKKAIARQDMSGGIYGMDGDRRTYTDPKDGTVYVWDNDKNAWFPKVDDDFLAQYQLNYGFTEPESESATKPPEEEVPKPPPEPEGKVPGDSEPPSLKRKQPDPPTWFDVDEKTNTKVYVSNLHADTTEQEFVDLMQKCGLVMKDIDTGKMKIKLYTEPGTNVLKGDGLCTYIKVESVQLALNLLDGYEFKGQKIKVERAKFTMKGPAYDPSLKPKKKKKKALEKMRKMQEKLFDWRPDKIRGERAKHERTVIIKNLFDLTTFDRDPGLILEYQQDLREECGKCGDLRKVIVHDRHPEGVAQIIFKEAEAADACVQLLNGRWFGQRKIEAATWDGKTKYKIHETEEEIAARIDKWEKHLEAEDEENESPTVKQDQGNGEKPEKTITEKIEGAESDGTRSSAGSGDETD